MGSDQWDPKGEDFITAEPKLLERAIVLAHAVQPPNPGFPRTRHLSEIFHECFAAESASDTEFVLMVLDQIVRTIRWARYSDQLNTDHGKRRLAAQLLDHAADVEEFAASFRADVQGTHAANEALARVWENLQLDEARWLPLDGFFAEWAAAIRQLANETLKTEPKHEGEQTPTPRQITARYLCDLYEHLLREHRAQHPMLYAQTVSYLGEQRRRRFAFHALNGLWESTSLNSIYRWTE